MSENEEKIPLQKRAQARRAARALRGGVPEPKSVPEKGAEPEAVPDELVDGGNFVEGNLSDPYPADGPLDPNEDPLARPSTRDISVVKPPASDEKPDDDIPAGRDAKAVPMKPIELPNDGYGPHTGLGD